MYVHLAFNIDTHCKVLFLPDFNIAEMFMQDLELWAISSPLYFMIFLTEIPAEAYIIERTNEFKGCSPWLSSSITGTNAFIYMINTERNALMQLKG